MKLLDRFHVGNLILVSSQGHLQIRQRSGLSHQETVTPQQSKETKNMCLPHHLVLNSLGNNLLWMERENRSFTIDVCVRHWMWMKEERKLMRHDSCSLGFTRRFSQRLKSFHPNGRSTDVLPFTTVSFEIPRTVVGCATFVTSWTKNKSGRNVVSGLGPHD